MFRCLLYLVLMAISVSVAAQVKQRVRVIKPVKPKAQPSRTDLGIGLGVTNSVLFLARNTKDRNDALGYTASFVYGGNKPFRASLEYTHYNRIDIAPTWYDIKANTIELNGHALFHSKGNICFYLLSGLSYNVFKGYFTGLNDYLNLTSLYSENQNVTTRWLGINTGIGFEYTFKKIIIFGNYKMRLGRSEGYNDFNIQDVCYSFGLRYRLRAPSVYRLFKGTRNRYFLDAE